MNPPMAHYIHILPVYLASLSGVEIPTAFYIFVLALAVYSATALLFLLSRLTPVFSLPSRLVLAAVCLLFSLWVLRAGEFGQRDHLFALAYIPWLYCRVIRHGRGGVPAWVGIVIGLIGGPLFLLKPHFCVIVALRGSLAVVPQPQVFDPVVSGNSSSCGLGGCLCGSFLFFAV